MDTSSLIESMFHSSLSSKVSQRFTTLANRANTRMSSLLLRNALKLPNSVSGRTGLPQLKRSPQVRLYKLFLLTGNAVESYETKALSRAVSPKDIVITEVTANLCFYGQMVSEQEKLTKLTDEMRTYFTETPPTAGAYKGIFLKKFPSTS